MFTDSLKLSSESMNRVNKLFMDTYEGIVNAQVASLRGYMDIVTGQGKSALAIRSLEDLKEFIENQPTRFNEVVGRVSEDFEHFSKVSEDFRNEASQLFRESVDTAAERTTTQETGAAAKTPSTANS